MSDKKDVGEKLVAPADFDGPMAKVRSEADVDFFALRCLLLQIFLMS